MSATTTASRLLSSVSGRRCLLTVGTTNFDSLIRHLDAPSNALTFLTLLSSLHFTHLTIQLGGTSRYTPTHLPALAPTLHPPLTLDLLHLTPSLTPLLTSSHLILSHAGAGSIVESLRLHLPLICVINASLMDNHQLQLARALAAQRFLYMATVDNVLEVLKELDEGKLRVEGDGERGAGRGQGEGEGEGEEGEGEGEGEGEEGEGGEGDVDDSMWGARGEVVYVDYHLRSYPPASNTAFLTVLEQEMDLL